MDIIPENTPQKQCTVCGETFSATPEFFQRNKHGKYGLQAECKTCSHARNKEWRERPGNKEHQGEYGKEYRSQPEIRERYKVHNAEYRKIPEIQSKRKMYSDEYKNRPGIREHGQSRQKAYHQRPEIRARYRANRRVYDNKPDIREKHQIYSKTYNAKYRFENKDRLSAQKKVAYNQPETREQYRATRKAYHSKPEIRLRLRERNQRRRALKLNAPGTYTTQDMLDQYKRQKGKCYWCQQKIKWEGHHDDHIVPLSRNGTNWPDNMCVSCATCNLKKHDRLPHEFPEGNRLL